MAHLRLVSRMPRPQPWNPAVATEEIRRTASSRDLTLTYRDRAIEQFQDRGLLIGDVLHVLKHGFVYAAGRETTRENLYKYTVESNTPNSGNRAVRVVVVADSERCWLKVIEVMWVDERCYVGRR